MDIIRHIPAVAFGLWIVDNVFGQPDQPPLEFHVDDAVEHYRQFIAALRERLASGNTSHGIQILRNPDIVGADNNQRYLLLQLSNEQNLTITLVLDITDAYVVGYRAENRSYFFRDYYDTLSPILFTDTNQTRIPFRCNYDGLEGDIAAGAQKRAGPSSQRIINRPSISRGEIDLGMAALQAAISSLYNYERRTLARSFIVLIQMIAEAARFTYIERRVIRSIETHMPFRPDPCMLTLENSWNPLSEGVQRSNGQGEFRRQDQLQLVTPNGQIYIVLRVTRQILESFGLALVKYENPGHDEL
ncbi:ribosome-inactivating protein bryodin II-like [Mercurialis annua]|uniref:ribosome-inactivating protein bryodin II-like n=1 Tax=Mercurialis annua TaxID=3986 RepID=UPI00215E445E|nr:ribosome-inactivating protein bryodin II-like [Mercurialis annua]